MDQFIIKCYLAESVFTETKKVKSNQFLRNFIGLFMMSCFTLKMKSCQKRDVFYCC